jgi:tetratricopeptide (TPR) repeat protein
LPAAAALAQPLAELSEGLETPVQLIYLAALLGFLVVGAFLVVRQVLIRRELEEAAKVLGERVRTGEATSEDSFELGVILLRKKLFTQATKNLEKAKKGWQGEEEELAQVHNALGYAYFNMERVDDAVAEYKAAVSLQPGYVTAWNNLGDAYERLKEYKLALDSYREALSYAPDNKVAQSRADFCKTRCERTGIL